MNAASLLMVTTGAGILAFAGYMLYKKKKEQSVVVVEDIDAFPGPYRGQTINELDASLDPYNENRHVSEMRNRALNTIRRRIAEISELPTDGFKVMTDLDELSRVKHHGDCAAEVIYDVVQIMIYDPDIGDPLRGIQSVVRYEELALQGAKAYLIYFGLAALSNIDLTDVC